MRTGAGAAIGPHGISPRIVGDRERGQQAEPEAEDLRSCFQATRELLFNVKHARAETLR